MNYFLWDSDLIFAYLHTDLTCPKKTKIAINNRLLQNISLFNLEACLRCLLFVPILNSAVYASCCIKRQAVLQEQRLILGYIFNYRSAELLQIKILSYWKQKANALYTVQFENGNIRAANAVTYIHFVRNVSDVTFLEYACSYLIVTVLNTVIESWSLRYVIIDQYTPSSGCFTVGHFLFETNGRCSKYCSRWVLIASILFACFLSRADEP